MRGQHLAHLGASHTQRVAFCYYLFDTFATAELRLAYVKQVAASANVVTTGGGLISATSSNGASVQFQFPSNWSPEVVLALTNEARTWAACETVAAAIALIGVSVRYVSPDFSGLRA